MIDPLHPTVDSVEQTADTTTLTADNVPINNEPTDMSNQVDPTHNLVALLLGTGEFSFSENAINPADTFVKGWRDFGNIMAFTPDIKPTKLQHVGSYRGVRRVDRQVISQTQTNYKIKVDEANLENVRIMYGTTDTSPFTQGALSAASGQPFGFGTVAAVIGFWYDIMTAGGGQQLSGVTVATTGTGVALGDTFTVAGGTTTQATVVKATAIDSAGKLLAVSIVTPGVYSVLPTTPNTPATSGSGTGVTLNLSYAPIVAVQLRNLTTVTISALVEGTDFVLDLLNGRIKFLTAQATNRTPVITCPAIAAGDDASFFGLVPMANPTKRGYGRLTVYDQNQPTKVVLQHYNFSCDITLDATSEIDGTKWNDNTIDVLVTSDVGTLYVRNANQNSGIPSA